MRLQKLLAAACMSTLLFAGCSASTNTSSSSTGSTAAAQTTTDKTKDQTSTTSSKDTTTSKSNTTSSAAQDETSAKDNATTKDTTSSKKDTAASTKDTAAAQTTTDTSTTANTTLDKITTDLKSKGYRIQKELVDWDNGINASTVKQELECEGVNDFNIWEFNSEADASASFANIEAHEKMDADNVVTRDGNLITVKERDDIDVEYYVLSGSLIVESDSSTAPATFATWGLM